MKEFGFHPDGRRIYRKGALQREKQEAWKSVQEKEEEGLTKGGE